MGASYIAEGYEQSRNSSGSQEHRNRPFAFRSDPRRRASAFGEPPSLAAAILTNRSLYETQQSAPRPRLGRLGLSRIRPRQQPSTGRSGTPPPHQPGLRGPRGHRPGPLIVAALDVNKDGVIDAQELANAPAALLALDKNGDGQLTKDELAPPPPRPPAPPADAQAGPSATADAQGAPPPPPPPHGLGMDPVSKALDANGDGVIDANEIANATAALKALDKNGDGQLTPDELRPPRQGPPVGQAGHGPGRPPRPQPQP